MALGLYSLLESLLLFLNAVCILNEDRFIAKYFSSWSQADSNSLKSQTYNLVRSIRTVMRVPLIGINAVVIVYKLLLG